MTSSSRHSQSLNKKSQQLTNRFDRYKERSQTNRGPRREEERSEVKLVLGDTLDSKSSDKGRAHGNRTPDNLGDLVF